MYIQGVPRLTDESKHAIRKIQCIFIILLPSPRDTFYMCKYPSTECLLKLADIIKTNKGDIIFFDLSNNSGTPCTEVLTYYGHADIEVIRTKPAEPA